MADTVANVIVGKATVKVDTVDVGATEGGVTIENAREYFDVTADPWLGIVKKIKISEKVIVKFVMAEATLANLAVAWGYPTSAVGGGVFTFGGGATITERVLEIKGNGPNGGTRTIALYKCVPIASGAHSYKKDDKTMIEIEFEVLEDTGKDANERFGTFTDTGADTTGPEIALSTPVDDGEVANTSTDPVIWTITETGNDMDESTIVYGDTFNIINTTAGSDDLEPGTIVYSVVGGTKYVTFTPTVEWNASDTFQAIVTTGLKDMAGNNLPSTKVEQFSVAA